jgi:glycosyltransferase involved in cell wall biosynthesis
MTKPPVSVVIPTRNRSALIGTAIASALGQTLSDLEVIVVDDASEDGTADVVAAFRDARLRFLRQGVRLGAPAARNAGIRSSSGEFVAFLDDDDEWFPDKLESQLEVFRRGASDLGVVYSSYMVVSRDTGRVVGRKVAEKRGDLGNAILERNYVGSTSSVVVRRSALERVGPWDERLPSFQDYDLWIRLSRICSFDFVDRDLLRYSVHAKKIWTNLDALDRGIELMVEKHGSSRLLRRHLSRKSLGVGVQYCSRGEMSKGRVALHRAFRLDPCSPRAVFDLALSLLPGPVFRAVREARERWSSASAETAASAISEETGR